MRTRCTRSEVIVQSDPGICTAALCSPELLCDAGIGVAVAVGLVKEVACEEQGLGAELPLHTPAYTCSRTKGHRCYFHTEMSHPLAQVIIPMTGRG